MIAQGWLLLVAGVVGAAGGAWVTDNALTASHEAYKATVANDAKDNALAVLAALEKAGSRVQAAEATISEQRLQNAKADEEVERLNNCIKSGKCGLRVAAKCPDSANLHTAPGDSASGNTAAGARLTPAAESDYLEFQRLYAEQLKVLRICKAYGETQKLLN